uniref:E3 ubiquitin-protein ligase n=2 Tax=Sphaeramia orbicularis TaxID=375764 RepID=A0A673BTX3_9TELE
MSIKDPAIADGLTIDEDDWKLITTSYSKDLEKIKAKFGVDFKESGITQGKTTVKMFYKRSGGNPSMESHAVRALLRLYQKVAMSPMNAHWVLGDSSKNRSSVDEESEGASAGPFMNGQSRNTEASTVGGATGGKDEEDKCPICLDTFNNKTQLKCKHEFCEECLENSKKSTGAMCPVCKDVFGLIEGDQPDGQMTWDKSHISLPGFPKCGSIRIHYHIPSGIQTERHPKPGNSYTGISRTAYLPDNKEGNEVLLLLKKAFDQRLIFTVGMSRTTGLDNQVTWNDIHHKTSMIGGPQSFGYPDPDYLTRVKEELQAKGIK